MNVEDYVISLSKFLSIYYNFEGEVLKKITHEQICDVLDLGVVPINEITTENISTGQIILVKDIEGKVLGYKKPYIKTSDSYLENPSTMMITFDEKPNIEIEDITDYSNHELTELIKICKKAKDDKTKKIIIKELHKREGTEKHSNGKIRKKDFRKE